MKNFVTAAILALSVAVATSKAQPAIYKIADLQTRISNPDTVYVVNFWATWCKPCVKELPAFDSLHVKYHQGPAKVLLVSLDFSEHLSTRVQPFLDERKVKSECVLLDEPDGNTFINAISPKWSGAIPATLVKQADRRQFVEGELTLAELEELMAGVK